MKEGLKSDTKKSIRPLFINFTATELSNKTIPIPHVQVNFTIRFFVTSFWNQHSLRQSHSVFY